MNENDPGTLQFEIEIGDAPLRAFTLDWDLEIWGGDPADTNRGTDGGETYYEATVSHKPGELFYTAFDGADTDRNTTLIDGNIHSVRGNTSGIVEVDATDGAVGNTINLTFNANFSSNDKGWISAIDNVRIRALAPGDANGMVDVQDLLTLLGGQKFNKGVDGVTWAQGDFNADDQFDTGDLLSMLAYLSGQFPSDPYASEAGSTADEMADVIVNSVIGAVTIDLAGHTASPSSSVRPPRSLTALSPIGTPPASSPPHFPANWATSSSPPPPQVEVAWALSSAANFSAVTKSFTSMIST